MIPSDAIPAQRLLLTGPAGSGKTFHACERIRLAATRPGRRGRGAGPPGSTLLVLPTYAQAMHLERVALSRWDARAILDDPFATFTSAGERFLDGFRVRALPSAVERDRLVEEALREAAVPAFAGVRDRPGFRARILRLAKEVKQSGRPIDEAVARLAAGAADLEEGSAERLRGFLEVFERYQELLRRADLEDHEDTLRRLHERLRSEPPEIPPQVLVVDGFDDFTPVEQAILDALTDAVTNADGSVVVTLPWDERRPRLFAASEPARRHLLGHGFQEQRLAGFPRASGEESRALAAVASRLFLRDDPGSLVGAGDAISMVVAGDPEDEAEAMAREARRLHAEGVLAKGWRDLGVVVRRLDAAGPRIVAAFERLGIPVRWIGGGAPLASEAFTRVLHGPLRVLGGRWEAGRFDASQLLTWLRWRASGDPSAVDGLEIEWRKHGYPRDFQAFLAGLEGAGLDASDLATRVEALASLRGAEAIWPALEEAVLGLADLPGEGGLDPLDGRPLDPAADLRRARAAAARDRLVGLIRGLGRAAARTGLDADVDAADAVDTLLDGIEQARLVVPDRRLDAVNVLDAEEARFWELPVVFVGGLAQGSFPLHPREDVVLRDADREVLADAMRLPLARERERRERRLLYGVLTRATRRLVLFRPGYDAGGDARAASLYLRDVERVVDLEPVTVRRPVSVSAPSRAACYTPLDWTLFAAARARDPHATDADRDLARALLARGDPTRLARAARWGRSDADPAHALETHAARFAASVAEVSATSIAAALQCRYRFFLRSVVGVGEDDVPFAGPAYGPRDQGTLVHEALLRAVVEPDVDAAEIAAALLDDARRGTPADALESADEEAEVARVVRLFRRREEAIGSVLAPLPDGLELAFGREEAVLLEQGGRRLALRGQIDRIDVSRGRAIVIDYKRSAGSAEHAARRDREGIDVQLPLYAHVVEALYGLDVAGFEWVAALVRARYGVWRDDAADLAGARDEEAGTRKAVPPGEFRERLDEALGRSLDVVDSVRALDVGHQRDDAKRCGECGWRSVCRPVWTPVEDPA